MRTGGGKEAELTPTKTNLVACLMTNAGSVGKREKLMSNVWGDGCRMSYFSLAAQVCRLRRKIEEDPGDPGYIRSVKGAGNLFWMA